MSNNDYIELFEKDGTLNQLHTYVGFKYPEYKGEDAKDITQNAIIKFLEYYDSTKGSLPKSAIKYYLSQEIYDFGKAKRMGGDFGIIYESLSSYLDSDEDSNYIKELPMPEAEIPKSTIERTLESTILTGKLIETLIIYAKQYNKNGEIIETSYSEEAKSHLKRIFMICGDLVALNNDNTEKNRFKAIYPLPIYRKILEDIYNYFPNSNKARFSEYTLLVSQYRKKMIFTDPLNRAYMQQAINLTKEQQIIR